MLGLNKFYWECVLNAATEHSSPRRSDENHKLQLWILPVPISTFKPGISQMRDKNIPRFSEQREFCYNGRFTSALYQNEFLSATSASCFDRG
jgi:hypothetical protein